MGDFIQPRVLKGFRDILPADETRRRATETMLERVFGLFGFVPIDTPILEYSDVLLGKGGGETDKQVYRFHDHGDRDVAMRFDLTVPFARFMAIHGNELPRPFKRYHIGKVFRGENTQRGRFREFVQCDFDIVGIDHAGADAEILRLMQESISSLGVDNFTIHIAHRGLFNRFLEKIGVSEYSIDVLRVVDKLKKIGAEMVHESLAQIVGEDNAKKIVEYISVDEEYEKTIAKLTNLVGGECEEIDRLVATRKLIGESDDPNRYTLDPSITRGLDYYTGIVFETYLDGLDSYGSICSGGRYNDLASLYTKSIIPGVGASIGLDRLLAALSDLDKLPRPDSVQVTILNLDETLLPRYFEIAAELRNNGISCDVAFESRKLAAQFKRSELVGAKYALICGEEEMEARTVNLKHLDSRESQNGITLEVAIQKILAK